jgi:hypothetical protein
MRLRPNPTSGVPVYLQLAEQFKREIQAGAVKTGEPLPRVSDLATELVINPTAVERAYRALERDGFIDGGASYRVVAPHECSHREAVLPPFDFAHGAPSGSRGAAPGAGPTRAEGEGAPAGAKRARSYPSEARALPWELSAARDVQQRLLPQVYPPVDGIEYAGVCRPALAVGGDYYDFIRRSNTELTIAIGDVCGKGVPAALLMATLRAFLHGETRHRVASPALLVQTLNQLACGSFASNRFASFFFAHFEGTTRTLRYVNAGHPPPLIWKASGDDGNPIRLRQGGPVLGLITDCAYDEGRVVLDPGDVFIAFTDGITEAMNEGGEEWGEDRLLTLIRRAPSSARELIDDILCRVDRFAEGSAQHDDMTLIAMRLAAVD